MLGSLYCQLHMKHNLQDMNDQLEFLNEVAKNDNIESVSLNFLIKSKILCLDRLFTNSLSYYKSF